MTIKFYLKHPARESMLSMRYRHPGINYIQYSTGIKVNPDHWDPVRYRLKETGVPHDVKWSHQQTNRHLDKLERDMKEIHFTLLAEGKHTRANLLNAFLLRQGAIEAPVKYLIDFMDILMDERRNSGMYKKGTIKVINTARQKLYGYESHIGKHMTFEEIDMNFFHDFMEYLQPNGYKKNYLNKIVRNIKHAMAESLERGLHSNTKFTSRKFSVPKEEVFNIYLSMDDIQKLTSVELTSLSHQISLTLFLIACFTGLRFGDIERLTKDHFSDGYLRIIPQKDKKKRQLVIPINPMLRKILQDLDYQIPKSFSNQKMNVHLKDICKIAEITDPVMKDGKTYHKYQLVSTHTARRSFATNAFKAGVPAISIMKITGHTTEQSFMKYIKISPEENAELMAKNPFFSMLKIS